EKLTKQMAASLKHAAGDNNVVEIPPDTGSEDFAYYVEKVPGMFFFVGACPPDADPAKAASHHTPDFMMDEGSMLVGLKAMLQLTLDYMYAPAK
ncbi:MAG TPA: M20/M25/M40 family metallo-hydrolase, partial [Cyclobacteriaceae bacterium]|nr:M20/M25/M40 family metallo-hydrolase [Cyclobacteriaceae bacterium]